jgi:hypothetical protein
VLEADHVAFSMPAARAILGFGFDAADKDRMRELSAKAKQGTLTAEEQAVLNNCETVGHMLSLMKSKARRSLKLAGAINGNAAH